MQKTILGPNWKIKFQSENGKTILKIDHWRKNELET